MSFHSVYWDILILVTAFVIGLVTYFKWMFGYWKRKGVPYLDPSLPFGTMGDIFHKQTPIGILMKENYEMARSMKFKHLGLFYSAAPAYMPAEPDNVKNILTRDFDHFMDHGAYYNEKDDPLSAHLFMLESTKWRNVRVKLTPIFSSGKIKRMFPLFVECGSQMTEAVDRLVARNAPMDIKDVLARFATNVIGSCAFGFDCNCFKEKDSEFLDLGRQIFHVTRKEGLKMVVGYVFPNLAKRVGLTITPHAPAKFFMKLIKDTFEYREKNNIVRNDFIQLLVELKNSKEGEYFTTELLAAQAFVFFTGGFETTSTTMTFCLFELALHFDVQEKLRQEIKEVLKRHGGEVTYNAISEMNYLDQVIDETLRKYPPFPLLIRKCTKTYIVPDTDLKIDTGTHVIIPILGMHYDPDYFPNPDDFDPERFSDKNKCTIKPFTYLPFGEGPRNCIGTRFGVLQIKTGIAMLVTSYKFTLTKKIKVPLEMDPFSFILSAREDILLDVEKADD